MPEIDPLGIESNRWRKLNGAYQDLMTSMQSENCWNPPNGPILDGRDRFCDPWTEMGINKKTALEIMLPRRNIDPKRVLRVGMG